MRDLLGRVGVKRCNESAPHPTQCGTGRAACGCGTAPPCHFTITELTAAAGKLELSLPGPDRAANAALIAEALQLKAAIHKKGNLGQNSDGEKVTRNWPVVGYRIPCGGEALENPVPILNLLCNGVVVWDRHRPIRHSTALLGRVAALHREQVLRRAPLRRQSPCQEHWNAVGNGRGRKLSHSALRCSSTCRGSTLVYQC